MKELTQYENNFIKKMEKNNEEDILGSLTKELTDKILDKVLNEILYVYNRSQNSENNEISTINLLRIIRNTDYDPQNTTLLMRATKKSFEVIKKYNIDIYYVMYYSNNTAVEHKVKYENGIYYIVDNFNMRRIIDFDPYSLSRMSLKTTKSNLTTLYYDLKNKERKQNKPKVKRINNQLF